MNRNIITLIYFSFFLSFQISAQNQSELPLSIRDDGNNPDASAMLDVQSLTKGMLIPRMTAAQRTAIANPATGLLVFDTDGASFWFFNGSTWLDLSNSLVLSDADNDTKIQVEESADDDVIRFDIAGTEFGSMDGKTFQLEAPGSSLFIGVNAGKENTSGLENTFIGRFAGSENTTGSNNTFLGINVGKSNTNGNFNSFIGNNAGSNNTAGNSNTFFGNNAGEANATGGHNTFIGASVGKHNTTGNRNTYLGNNAGKTNTIGDFNTFVGDGAGEFTTTGTSNTFIGRKAGSNNLTGIGNVFLGVDAGRNEFGSNKLYIENSNADNQNALIYGEFDNDFVRINGNLSATEGLSDADFDTKIQVEESADDDVIRFDIAGTEFAKMDGKVLHVNSPGQSLMVGNDAGLNDDGTDNRNTFIGYNAGKANIEGSENTFIGHDAGLANEDATSNTFIGFNSGRANTEGFYNTMVGHSAGESNTTGAENVFMGIDAGRNNTTGILNTFIGTYAGDSNSNGERNTYLGYDSGAGRSLGNRNTCIGTAAGFVGEGSNNVFLGAQAGFNEMGSNRLYIENSTADSNNALIYGEFDNDFVRINGYLLATQGLSDADFDTKIILEESPDEDTIRFDIAGTEFVKMDGKTLHMEAAGNSLFMGTNAGKNDDGTENQNTFTGVYSGWLNTTGQNNTFSGTLAGSKNTSGSANTFIGRIAGRDNTTGSWNTFLGTQAGALNTTGEDNTFVGRNAGVGNLTGIGNICIGESANVTMDNFTNAVAIGQAATVNASNKVRLGNSSITVIEGQVDWSFPSDGRFKNNVQENVKGLDFILQLRPVTYNFDVAKFNRHIQPENNNSEEEDSSNKERDEHAIQQASNIVHSGFIAQEVEQAIQKTGYENFSGLLTPQSEKDNYGLRYGTFVVPLVKAVQEQQALIDHQANIITDFQVKFENQESINIQLKTELQKIKSALLKAGVEMD